MGSIMTTTAISSMNIDMPNDTHRKTPIAMAALLPARLSSGYMNRLARPEALKAADNPRTPRVNGTTSLPKPSFTASDRGTMRSACSITGAISPVIAMGKVSVAHHSTVTAITTRVLTASGFIPAGAGSSRETSSKATPSARYISLRRSPEAAAGGSAVAATAFASLAISTLAGTGRLVLPD